jgi:hypothetical protein
MSETADAQRLLARGRSVQLADGATHEFRFSNRALVRIEADYETLDAFTDALKAKPFSTLAYAIHLTLGVPLDQAIDLIDTRRTHQYLVAIGEAFEEALPEQDVAVRILQAHSVGEDHYRAGTVVTVPAERAAHLIGARVAVMETQDPGNAMAAPGESSSPGAASSALPSSAGTSTQSASGT